MISRPPYIPFLAALVLVSLPALGHCEAVKKAEDTEKVAEKTVEKRSDQVDQLIEQLGSASYVDREQAETGLLELNMEAFESLILAQKHKDPEIAARARYLVRQIQINLVMPDDSPRVAQLMSNIFTLALRKQEEKIAELAMLPNGEGLSALCRLIRFSESETSAKAAAMGIMQSRLYSKKDIESITDKLSSSGYPVRSHSSSVYRAANLFNTPGNHSGSKKKIGQPLGQKERDKIRRLLESCRRPAATIVFAWFDFEEAKTDTEKKKAYGQWSKLCLQEEKLLDNISTRATSTIFSFLLMTQIEKAVELKLNEEVQVALVQQQLKRTPFGNQTNYKEIINRLIEEKVWKLADISIPEFGQVMASSYRKDTLPRFFCLLIHAGKTKLADELFELYEKSFHSRGTAKAGFHIQCEWVFIQEGLYDRAVAQHEAATKVENLKQARSPEHLACWYSFPGIMHMYEGLEQYELAAQTAEGMLKKLESMTKDQKNRPAIKLLIEKSKCSSAYHRAMAEKQKGNEAEYRKLLEEAFNAYPDSSRVLIERYRLPVTPTSQAFHDRVVDQIKKTVVSITKQVKMGQKREENANNMAWLVANTEGDLDTATKLLESTPTLSSKRNSGVLDTLALCYYKKGNIERAVSLQREALVQLPHDRRLKETWKTYSAAYEKKTGKKPKPPKTGTARFREMINLPPK